jgi:N-methylhydantoinase B/oxoprolinase/acetone carboxylase alpha subunit
VKQLAVMKVTAATLAVAVSVAAQPKTMARDASTITNVLSSVATAMTNADSQLAAYHGGSPIALREASHNLYTVIHDNVETLKNMEPLTHDDVIAITDISIQVTTIGGKYLEDLGAAAPVFAANGLCEYLYNYSVELGKFLTHIRP